MNPAQNKLKRFNRTCSDNPKPDNPFLYTSNATTESSTSTSILSVVNYNDPISQLRKQLKQR
jgi:hypothetical protein